MKTLSNLNNLSLLALALLVTFGACSSVNNDVEAISAEDVDLAAHIVTTSIADDESGMMSSLYDAFSDVSSEGITYGANSARFKADPESGNDGRDANATSRTATIRKPESIALITHEVFKMDFSVNRLK